MKNILIHTKTKEEHLCNKITANGFDYYVSDEIPNDMDYYFAYSKFQDKYIIGQRISFDKNGYYKCKKIIATNNPNINIPKIVDKSSEIITDDVVFVIDLPNCI
jgi:hypothetical protein